VRNFATTGRPKVVVFALGPMQKMARDIVEQLGAEADVAIVNARFFKPIDAACHEFFGKAADVVVTLEDHALMGGYGSAVIELFSEKRLTTPVVRIGWPDVFVEHATTVDYLREKHGLTAANAVKQVREVLASAVIVEPRKAIQA